MRFALTCMLSMALLCGCATTEQNSTKSAEETSLLVAAGMSYSEVLEIFSGLTMRRTFRDSAMALQVCSGGFPNLTDQYVTVWFVDDKVSGLTQWNKPADWSCKPGMREVDWGQAPADVKVRLEVR